MRVGLVVMPSSTPMSAKVLIEETLAVSRNIFNIGSPRFDEVFCGSGYFL
jgi:hypothetical protein